MTINLKKKRMVNKTIIQTLTNQLWIYQYNEGVYFYHYQLHLHLLHNELIVSSQENLESYNKKYKELAILLEPLYIQHNIYMCIKHG